MLSLPVPNQTNLKSFSIAVGLTGSIFLALFFFFLGLKFSSLSLMPILLTLLGLGRPELMRKPYNVWNRISVYVARSVRFALLGICYYVVFLSVCGLGSTIRKRPLQKNATLWMPRGTLSSAAYGSQSTATDFLSKSEMPWLLSFFSWAALSKNPWVLCLLPFLILVRNIEYQQEEKYPSSIYTLF